MSRQAYRFNKEEAVRLQLQKLTKPWLQMRVFTCPGILKHVPEHYKKFYWEWVHGPRTAVHYIPEEGMFKHDEDGRVIPVQNIPLVLKFPKELGEGIWGGEAVLKGFIQKKKLRRRFPKYWVPSLQRTVVYSEILNRYMEVTVTERALRLIDEHYGLDGYIMKTSTSDLLSLLSLRLRREMLLALIRGTIYPDDSNKRSELIEKYQQFLIPEEEADWYGLSLREAKNKQLLIEEAQNIPKPLKGQFRAEFIQYLHNNPDLLEEKPPSESASKRGLMSKLNPFSKSDKEA